MRHWPQQEVVHYLLTTQTIDPKLGTPDALGKTTAECPSLLGAEREFDGVAAKSETGSNGVQS
jgi:hypothetical protein